MSQQINLLNESLRPQKDVFTSGNLLMLAGGFMLLLCVVAGVLWQQVRTLEAERADWSRRAQEANANLVQVSQQLPPRQPSAALQAEIKVVEEKIQSRERVFAVLKSGVVGKSQGFSSMMEAFARQSVDGLWLTGVSMNASGDQMRISGNALTADLIPQYITRLSAEQALRGRSFTAFQVGLPKPAAAAASTAAPVVTVPLPAYVEFVLSADKVVEGSGGAPVEAKR